VVNSTRFVYVSPCAESELLIGMQVGGIHASSKRASGRLSTRHGEVPCPRKHQPVQSLSTITDFPGPVSWCLIVIVPRFCSAIGQLKLWRFPMRLYRPLFSRMLPIAFLMGCLLVLPQSGKAQQITYSGEAMGAYVDVLGAINTSISDTGPLPAVGGSLSAQLATLDLSGLLSLQVLSASTNGENNQTNSQASVVNVNLNAVGLNIQASVLTSNATASCSSGNASVSGTSNIAALTVNGRSIKITGSPNQTVPLLIGSLIVNEQISSIVNAPNLTSADILVNALHLKVNGLANVVISSSHAGVSCSSSSPLPQ
jgi:hypothetical protein